MEHSGLLFLLGELPRSTGSQPTPSTIDAFYQAVYGAGGTHLAQAVNWNTFTEQYRNYQRIRYYEWQPTRWDWYSPGEIEFINTNTSA